MTDPGFPLLTTIVVLPVAGAVAVGLVPRQQTQVIKAVAFIASGVTALLTLYLLGVFDKGDAGFQFVSQHEWIPSLGILWKLGVDGISLFLIVLTGILFPIAIFGPHVHEDFK